MPLSIHNVANIFIKLRQHRQRAAETGKGHHIQSTSGETPQTHGSLVGTTSASRYKISREDFFICADGVDVPKLLRATRSALYDQALAIGANVLLEEHWSCTICGPKHRRSGHFHVKIKYTTVAARSNVKDPGKPVNLLQAKGVPGLMTILQRRQID